MRSTHSAALLLLVAAGCGAAQPLSASDYFPLRPGSFWLYQGTEEGQATAFAWRLVRSYERPTGGTGYELRAVWSPGDPEEMTLAWSEGFLCLETRGGTFRLLPERPDQVRHWTWEAAGRQFAGRVVSRGDFLATSAGRFGYVLVVELGPADGSEPRYRWHWAPGVGNILQTVGSPALRLELSRYSLG
ncbi:MAG: hypothetical protein L0216_16040 [Planctomycetales bacterium]|nr:hypothetical protein [Planctomycetales bacterium]